MWTAIGKQETDTRTLTGDPKMAKHAALMLLKAGLLKQSRRVDVQKEEDSLKENLHPQTPG